MPSMLFDRSRKWLHLSGRDQDSHEPGNFKASVLAQRPKDLPEWMQISLHFIQSRREWVPRLALSSAALGLMLLKLHRILSQPSPTGPSHTGGHTLWNLCSFFSQIEDFLSFLAGSHLGQSRTNYLGGISSY